MDENITHALSIVGSVILFIFALSCAIFSYESLEYRLKFFFDVHSITARREDATSQLLDSSTIQRKVKFEEVFIAIMDLPRYASAEGNISSTSIEVVSPAGLVSSFSVVPDGLEFAKYLICVNDDYSEKYYDINDEAQLNDLLEEIVFSGLGENITGFSLSNLALKGISDDILNTSFSISYDQDTIIYTANA